MKPFCVLWLYEFEKVLDQGWERAVQQRQCPWISVNLKTHLRTLYINSYILPCMLWCGYQAMHCTNIWILSLDSLSLLSSHWLTLDHRTSTLAWLCCSTIAQKPLHRLRDKGLTAQQYPLQLTYLHDGDSTVEKGSKPLTNGYTLAGLVLLTSVSAAPVRSRST